jgi:hypothetical protein
MAADQRSPGFLFLTVIRNLQAFCAPHHQVLKCPSLIPTKGFCSCHEEPAEADILVKA